MECFRTRVQREEQQPDQATIFNGRWKQEKSQIENIWENTLHHCAEVRTVMHGRKTTPPVKRQQSKHLRSFHWFLVPLCTEGMFVYDCISRPTVLCDCWGKHHARSHRSGDGEVRPPIWVRWRMWVQKCTAYASPSALLGLLSAVSVWLQELLFADALDWSTVCVAVCVQTLCVHGSVAFLVRTWRRNPPTPAGAISGTSLPVLAYRSTASNS